MNAKMLPGTGNCVCDPGFVCNVLFKGKVEVKRYRQIFFLEDMFYFLLADLIAVGIHDVVKIPQRDHVILFQDKL